MSKLASLTLVLGGQRSGKSAYAENLLCEGGIYLATGQASDPEMNERIKIHQARRGAGWTCIEEPLDLVEALNRMPRDKPVLLDSLGLWVSNMLSEYRALDFENIANILDQHPAPIVVVSEEVGLGLIPMNKVGRSFVDALGSANQIIAARADHVVLVTAGLPQVLKAQTQP